MTRSDMPLARGIDWIARLPLCGTPELGRLLGVHEHDARRLAYELSRSGWVESVEPGSAELEHRRRYVIRAHAAGALGKATSSSPIGRHLPVRLQDIGHRLARFEITVAVNRLLADLATELRHAGVAGLADARSLPLALPRGEWWWLPGADGYGCLRARRLWAPFLIAWDRASAPDVHRRRRVDRWSEVSAAVARRWGPGGLPPLLLVAPTPRERASWERALLKRAQTGAAPTVFLTTREALRTQGAGGAAWHRPGDVEGRPLLELLGWGVEPPVAAPRVPDTSVGIVALPRRSHGSLREWALKHAIAPTSGHAWQGVAGLALVTGPDEQALIGWIARHPLLSASELGALSNESRSLVERRLDWTVRYRAAGAIESTPVSQG